MSASTNTSISVVKSEAQTLLKKLDQTQDDVQVMEALYTMCLFERNRNALLDVGILSNLILGLKTKSPRIRAYIARTLQLFAQDGGDTILQMKRLNICNTCLEICSKMRDDENVLTPVAGLLYWLAQSPTCKKELQDMEASHTIAELNRKSKNPVLSKYLNYVSHALKAEVKSREEILNQIRTGETEVLVHAKSQAEKFEVTSPRKFKNLLRGDDTSPSAEGEDSLNQSTDSSSSKANQDEGQQE